MVRKSFIDVRLALIVAGMAMFASQASAGCHQVSSSNGGPDTEFTFCDDGPSGLKLNGREMIKYPDISVYRTPAGDISVSIQSASVDIRAANASGEGWAGRAGFLVPLPDHDEALSLAKAINAGETITIKAAHKSSEEAHTIFSGVFRSTFPAEFLSPDAGKEAAAPATPPTPVKAKLKPYPVSDLPSGLTSVALIPFEKGKEEEWREDYLRDARHPYMDAACQAAAYPYLRSNSYWRHLDDALKPWDGSNKNYPELTQESASALCADENAAADFRSRLLAGHPQNFFDRLCEFVNVPPASYRGVSTVGVPEGLCIDLAAVRDNEYDKCMRTRNSGYLKDKSDAEAEAYCGCSGDKAADYFADGTKSLRSTNLVEAATKGRGACSNMAQAQPAAASTKAGVISPASSQPAAPKPAPANAKANTTVEEVEEEADKAINKAKDKIKKGLGGLFN